jgi:hypothetical protein
MIMLTYVFCYLVYCEALEMSYVANKNAANNSPARVLPWQSQNNPGPLPTTPTKPGPWMSTHSTIPSASQTNLTNIPPNPLTLEAVDDDDDQASSETGLPVKTEEEEEQPLTPRGQKRKQPISTNQQSATKKRTSSRTL